MVLKIAVHADGAVLLEGEPIDLAGLENAFQEIQSRGAAVWYYREPADGEPPPEAEVVLQMAIRHKLPVRLSTRPDYSDYVDSSGVSHGTPPPVLAQMPAVNLDADVEYVFGRARSVATGENAPRGVVVVTPERLLMALAPPAANPAIQAMTANLERMLPSDPPRNIVSIAYTVIAAESVSGVPSGVDANRVIPFFGLLMGLCFIGHAVWIFEGHPSALTAGCREADVLIADSAMLPHLQQGWEETAAAAMRNPNILIHNRSTHHLTVLQKPGDPAGGLQFPNGPALTR